jgi:hypothetical protein
MPNEGVKVVQPYYKVVMGVPAAVVRSYKNPLYDSEQVLNAAPGTERVLYQKPIGQLLADAATTKTLLHTNMVNAGQLGTPLSFDVLGFNARLPKNVALADYRAITGAGVIQVLFGTDTVFLSVPLEDIPAGVDTEGMAATDSPHVGLGVSDNFYRFDIGGAGLHINSNESFSVKLQFPSGIGAVTANTLVRFYMRGILYKGL